MDGSADARADVYAAGIVLYELLTGRKPHEGESPIQVAYKHVHEDVPAPSRSVPGIPSYVDALVARATARDRELRPADARVMLHQVRRVRAALDHGITDDPELTADLTPTAPVLFSDSSDYVTEDAPTIVEPDRVPALHEPTLSGAERVPALPPARPSRGGAHPVLPAPPRRRRRGPLLLVLLLVLAVVAAGAGWDLTMGRYTVTPGVINLSEAQAREKVEAAGLEFTVGGRRFSETVAAGSVISTDPAAGSRILEEGTVTAVLSKGPERYEVPKLRGLTEDEAQEQLDEANLAFGESRERYSEKVPEGVVLRSDPAPGTELRPGTAVDLVVSLGPKPIKVPDFTGKDADRAERVLTDRGLVVDVTTENHDTVPEGRVISQSPNGGTLTKGDTVRLVVSEGPVLVEVPDVTGSGVGAATSALEAVGFTVRTTESALYVGLEYVVATDPEPGSMVPKGSVITLSLV